MNLFTAMRVFERVATLGGLSAAGRELGMSSTAVSRHLKELEDELGARLVNRTTRKLNLTEVGRNYFERAKVLLDEIDELQDTARGLHSHTRGLVKVSCSNVLGHTRITTLIPKFLRENPFVSVEFNLTSRYVVGVVEEGYDVAIRFGDQSDSVLIARRLGQVRNYVCATPSYFERHGRPAHPAELAGHECVLSNYAKSIGTWPFQGHDGPFSVPVRSRVSTNSVEAAYQMTLAGFGIGNLPSLLVDDALRTGRLEAVLQEYRPVSSPIYALYPHRTYVPAKVRAFVDFLIRELSSDLI
ncbi:LysR family transcriptional regulator [Pseudaminobacter soli (ex Li et al. 2025)]|uniref:LysR family transcriptional regulator n=1 Tax=Pseudaminobacter soli (ex Li et al. 2025) TaxID=1295366 RepID=A0A2P7S8V3_9HYPH|nr:LysR family transcriptional regulator [Mesorhizobium soli]PSJ58890.1 LysR family transcriptional regulator [Mesorhizobium soli]